MSVPENFAPETEGSFWGYKGVDLTKENKISVVQDINRKYEAWKSTEPSHYTYVISKLCYCVFADASGPIEVEVKEHVVVRATPLVELKDGFWSNQFLENKQPELNDSIDDVFRRLIKSIETPWSPPGLKRPYPPSSFFIDYDAQHGFPFKTAYHDYSISHGEWILVVQDFKVIE